MRPALVILAVVAVLVGAVSGASRLAAAPASTSAKPRSPFLPVAPFSPPHEIVLFGHVKSLTRKGAPFQARVDPAEWLGGVTANRAAVEDKVIAPGEAVPNDYYVRDEGHKLLTYRVHATARVTVITNKAGLGIRATAITVSELAEIVKGRNPKHRALFEPRNGFWIRIATDTVRSLDQQYSP